MAIKKIETAKHIEAAGIMFYCKDSGKFLTIYRGADVEDGNCWCGAGGKIEEGETPEEAAKREILEELGFDCDANDVKMVPLYTYESDVLTFYNFLGIVDQQFFPELNWESDGYAWTTLPNMPKPFHYGTVAILEDIDARDTIEIETGVAVSSDLVDSMVKADLREDLTADADEMPNNDYSAITDKEVSGVYLGNGMRCKCIKSACTHLGEGSPANRVKANLQLLISQEVDRRLGMVTARLN